MKTLKITFPKKTAKQIVEACDNKLGKGKLLYNTGWYEKEEFYTTEKCRSGTFEIDTELIGMGKDWNECKELIGTHFPSYTMLNFAETVYFIQEYFKKIGEYPWNLKWSWTSSSSSRGYLVLVGSCDSYGVGVGLRGPRRSYSCRGVVVSRSVSSKSAARTGQADSLDLESLEQRLEALEIFAHKVNKIINL